MNVFIKKIFLLHLVFLFIINASAQNYIDSLLNKVQELPPGKEKGDTYIRIAHKYLNLDLDKAIEYAYKAINHGLISKDPEILTNVNIILANAWYFKGNADSSKHFCHRSYNISLLTENPDKIAASLNRLGIISEATGNYEEAMNYYVEAIKYFKINNNIMGLGDIYNNMGLINHNILQYEKALEYYKKSLDAYIKVNDKHRIANTLNNIGIIHEQKQQADSALFYLKRALLIYKEMRSFSEISACYNNIGIIYSLKKKYDLAMHYYNKSMDLSKSRGDNKRLATSMLQSAEIYRVKKHYSKANELMLRALEIFYGLNDDDFASKTLRDLSKLYSEKGDYKKALDYYKEYTTMKDSLFSEKMQTKVSELQIKYETAEKDNTILKLENDANANKHTQEVLLLHRRLLIWILTAFGIILIISFFAFRTRMKLLRRNRDFLKQKEDLQKLQIQKKKAENELLKQEIRKSEEVAKLKEEQYKMETEHKTKNLISASLNIQNKNRMLRSIHHSVKQLLDISEATVYSKLKGLDKQINIHLHDQADWEELKFHFEKVNKGLLDRIHIKYPNLTENDLKLCALIKLNISSKEIAQMLNISVDGVNKSRQRLKKKLSLPKEVDLVEFVNNYK